MSKLKKPARKVKANPYLDDEVQVQPPGRFPVSAMLLCAFLGVWFLGIAAGAMFEHPDAFSKGERIGKQFGLSQGYAAGVADARKAAKIDLSNTVCSEGLSDKFLGIKAPSGKMYWTKCDYFFAVNSTPEGFWSDFEINNRSLPDGAVK